MTYYSLCRIRNILAAVTASAIVSALPSAADPLFLDMQNTNNTPTPKPQVQTLFGTIQKDGQKRLQRPVSLNLGLNDSLEIHALGGTISLKSGAETTTGLVNAGDFQLAPRTPVEAPLSASLNAPHRLPPLQGNLKSRANCLPCLKHIMPMLAPIYSSYGIAIPETGDDWRAANGRYLVPGMENTEEDDSHLWARIHHPRLSEQDVYGPLYSK